MFVFIEFYYFQKDGINLKSKFYRFLKCILLLSPKTYPYCLFSKEYTYQQYILIVFHRFYLAVNKEEIVRTSLNNKKKLFAIHTGFVKKNKINIK